MENDIVQQDGMYRVAEMGLAKKYNLGCRWFPKLGTAELYLKAIQGNNDIDLDTIDAGWSEDAVRELFPDNGM